MRTDYAWAMRGLCVDYAGTMHATMCVAMVGFVYNTLHVLACVPLCAMLLVLSRGQRANMHVLCLFA
jgi:hypothetical protein